MSRLIALIDGSADAQSVCDHAAWVAQRTGLAVEIVHVLGRREVASDTADLSGNIGLGARTALLEELADLDATKARLAQKRGRALLEDAKARLTAAGIADVSIRLRHGDVVETVQEIEKDVDLIVIGKRGEAADFATLHLGSNLERVARASHKPLLVASRAQRPIKRFLIAFDGGASALKAIDHLARSRMLADLECRLLTVGAQSPETTRRLQEAAARLGDAGYAVQTEIRPGQAETVIAEKVESESLDLLVMGAYGHSRIRHLIIGSTTTEMIRSCKIPVLLFR